MAHPPFPPPIKLPQPAKLGRLPAGAVLPIWKVLAHGAMRETKGEGAPKVVRFVVRLLLYMPCLCSSASHLTHAVPAMLGHRVQHTAVAILPLLARQPWLCCSAGIAAVPVMQQAQCLLPSHSSYSWVPLTASLVLLCTVTTHPPELHVSTHRAVRGLCRHGHSQLGVSVSH